MSDFFQPDLISTLHRAKPLWKIPFVFPLFLIGARWHQPSLTSRRVKNAVDDDNP
jgi:hypothetical protein